MRNVVLLGLQDSTNLGDTLVFACTERIIAQILKKHGRRDIGSVSVDMYGEECYGALDALAAKKDEMPADEMRQARKEKVVSCAAERARAFITQNTAAVIFFGGGIVKPGHSLKLGYCMEPYLRRADELGVPVMISAAGVDGYDAEDDECRVFAEILNLPCVKTVTVRDDIELLQRAYVTSPEIRVKKVPCPTMLSKELFPMPPRRETGVIGLGVIKPKKMTELHPDFTENRQIALWTEIISEVEKRGYRWRLFTNGLASDFRFIPEILTAAGRTVSNDTVLPNPRNVHRLLQYCSAFDGIVASRFHAAVPAYSFGVPFVELVWNIKQTHFAKDMHLEDSFFDPETASPAQIVGKLFENMKDPRPECPVDPQDTVDELERFLTDYCLK
ncbi:MAG: polysaccharide pyruvyl transferase family protein [Clostridia bacterium]|nr:polysaccharide pyruvyl transferase family protein [Clostridia bacterium]